MWQLFYAVKQPLPNLTLLSPTRRSSTTSLGGINSADAALGPLKAKSKMSVRKCSTENLLDDDKPSGPVRSSSLENIHSMSKQSSPSHAASAKGGGRAVGGAMSEKIVDAAVKLYQPDHSHKYIDISPVSHRGPSHDICACNICV